jgi:hypothetical protein
VPLDAVVALDVDAPAPTNGHGPGPRRRGRGEVPPGVWANRQSRFGLLAVVLVPFLANLPALVGLVDYQPLLKTSGLALITKQGYIPGQPYIDPNVGYNSQAIGHAAALAWVHGHVPWWNLNDGLGMPLAASVQSASFLPLTLLQLFASGSMWFHIALEIIGGVTAYALLRQLRCSPFAAAVGGIAYGLNGSIAWLTNAPANPLPFLPLCLLGVEYVVNAAGAKRRGGWVMLAMGVWLSVVAGFPEVAVINAGLVGAWFILRLVQRWPDRVGIILRAALGVAVGFLLAAPVLNAFLGLLKVANVGIHKFPLATFTLPSASLTQQVSPYVFGGILDSTDPTVFESWTRIGGYMGATLLVLTLGALWGRRERALRMVLFAWSLLFVGSNFDVPVLHQIVENIPGLTHLAVYRYDTASTLLCMCILAAFCLDDLRGLNVVGVAKRLVPGIAVSLAFFAIGFLSTPSGRAWAHLHVPRWYWGSIVLFVLVLGALVLAIVLAFAGYRSLVTVLIGVVLCVEALGYFEVPILAWPRAALTDTAPVTFLQQHLGIARYYSTGPAAPNYGAYYSIPSLGASDLPIPKEWGNHVHSRLSPCILPWQFGNGGPIAGCPISPVIAAMAYVTNYEADGVKYLMVGHRTHLAIFMQPQIGTGPPTEDGAATIKIGYTPPAYFHTGVLTKLSVDLPGGPPPGLVLTVCSGRPETCVSGTELGEGIGGENFALSAPLTLGSTLTITLAASAAYPVHVVTVPAPQGTPAIYPPIYHASVVADGVSLPDRQARVTFFYAPNSIPRLIKSTPTAHIYLLPHPSPIATAPGCTVSAHTMTSFTVHCPHPSQLTFRELDYKGWSATVGGVPTPITRTQDVLQQVAVPAGTHTVEFSYAPPRTALAWFAVLLGVLAIAVGLTRRRWPAAFAWWPWSPTTEPVPATGAATATLPPAGIDGAAPGAKGPPG